MTNPVNEIHRVLSKTKPTVNNGIRLLFCREVLESSSRAKIPSELPSHVVSHRQRDVIPSTFPKVGLERHRNICREGILKIVFAKVAGDKCVLPPYVHFVRCKEECLKQLHGGSAVRGPQLDTCKSLTTCKKRRKQQNETKSSRKVLKDPTTKAHTPTYWQMHYSGPLATFSSSL